MLTVVEPFTTEVPDPIEETIEKTRRMLLRSAIDVDEFITSIAQFERDMAEHHGDSQSQRVLCQSYWTVYGRWA